MYSDNKQIRDVADVAARIMAGLPPIKEALHPNQQKIDVVDDEKIDGKDFAKLRAGKKPDMKKEEIEIEEESHQSKTTMKHIPNPSPAQKQAAKDIKPGVGGYRDRIDMLKSAGVKEEVNDENARKVDKYLGKKYPLDTSVKKEEVEELEEVKMADLPSTKVQGRSYGASKPQPSAFDILKGPKNKELTAIDAEKKKKKISEMIAIYKEGGLKTFFESIKKEDLIIEEPDSEQFAKDLEDAKKRAAGTKPQADVAKASVQAVKQEAVEQIDELSTKTLASAAKSASDPDSDYHYGKSHDPQKFADHAKKTKDAKSAAAVQGAADAKGHYPRDNHTQGYDKLSYRTPARVTSAGKANKQDVKTLKGNIQRNEAVEQDIYVIDADLINGVAEINIEERTLTASETDKKENIVKSMKKGMAGFKERYGDRAKSVMYATATKQAKND